MTRPSIRQYRKNQIKKETTYIDKIKKQFPNQTKGLDNKEVKEVAKKLGVTSKTAIGKDLILGKKRKSNNGKQFKSLIPSNDQALKNRKTKNEFDEQVKKTLNRKTSEERNKKIKKPNIVKKVLKSVAKKIIPGGAVVGALTPKKMGDATLRSTDKPFVPKKKKK